MSLKNSTGKMAFVAVIMVIGLGFLAALTWVWLAEDVEAARPWLLEKSNAQDRHPVWIRQPRAEILVDSGRLDAQGEPIMVSCATCHDTRDPVVATNDATHLDQFHQGLRYDHGKLSCLSCHHADDYNRLKLSDGRAIDFSASMKLCAQCHGPQHRDYQNGSHGGMTGYWDLSRGPRQRNSCIDCHDPHHPAYPKVLPVFPPQPLNSHSPAHHE